ncbi:MAG: DUF1638 domain-containing protein [Sneathiella sp.]|uniref:DUF1638 domain-containing protein n=1 Tax=Sneathiella sp. TaxID=1964365 RepID=UPI003002A9D2
MEHSHPKTLLIACGALADETLAVIDEKKWRHLEITCLPAKLHNSPTLIPDAMRQKIRDNKADFDQILALYGDCGTGGLLDNVLREEGVERIPGAHCYEFFAGADVFKHYADAEPGTFYLTDYLARHFDRLIIKDLGIERHPELLPMYFGNYKKVLFLSQTKNAELQAKAKAAAERLSLEYEYRFTGLTGLENFLNKKVG